MGTKLRYVLRRQHRFRLKFSDLWQNHLNKVVKFERCVNCGRKCLLIVLIRTVFVVSGQQMSKAQQPLFSEVT
jgi:hypothetical protein